MRNVGNGKNRLIILIAGLMLIMLFSASAVALEDVTAPETLPLTDWMRYMPGDMHISQLNIPGTHDSGTTFLKTGTQTMGQCHDNTFPEQLEHGIRVFDIRLKLFYIESCTVKHNPYYKQSKGMSNTYKYHVGPEQLKVAHGAADCYLDSDTKWSMEMSLHFVFAYCCDFIRKHPDETVVLLIQDEGDGADDKYRKAFDATVNMIRNPEQYPYPSQSVYNPDKVPPVDMSLFRFYYNGEKVPTLDEVRGKILVAVNGNFDRNKEEKKSGARYYYPGVTKYQDKATTNQENKKNIVRTWLDKSAQVFNNYEPVWSDQGEYAEKDSHNPLFPKEPDVKLQFMSANTGFKVLSWKMEGPRYIATGKGKGVIQMLRDSYDWQKNRRYGWIMMDFEDDKLTRKIIRTNEYAEDIDVRIDVPFGVTLKDASSAIDLHLIRLAKKDRPEEEVTARYTGDSNNLEGCYQNVSRGDWYKVTATLKNSDTAQRLFSDVTVEKVSETYYIVHPVLRKVAVDIHLIWDDNRDQLDLRPEQFSFELYRSKDGRGHDMDVLDVDLPSSKKDTDDLRLESDVALLPEGYSLDLKVFSSEDVAYTAGVKKTGAWSWDVTMTLNYLDTFSGRIVWNDNENTKQYRPAAGSARTEWANAVRLKTVSGDGSRIPEIAGGDLGLDVIPVSGTVDRRQSWKLDCPPVERYILSYPDDSTAMYTFAAPIVPLVEWVNCPDNLKPDSLKVQLVRTAEDGTRYALETVEVTAADSWIPQFTGTWPLFVENGNYAEYTLELADAAVNFTEKSDTRIDGNGTVELYLTVTYVPTDAVSGKLIWRDEGRGNTVPHPKATVYLTGAVNDHTEAVNDQYMFDKLPDGKMELSLVLDPADPESAHYRVCAEGTDFILIYQRNVSVTLTWVDPWGNKLPYLPNTIPIVLEQRNADGETVASYTHALNFYGRTWTGIPVSDDLGNLYTWTLKKYIVGQFDEKTDEYTDEYGDLHYDITVTCKIAKKVANIPVLIRVTSGSEHPDETFAVTLDTTLNGKPVSESRKQEYPLELGETESEDQPFYIAFDAVGEWCFTLKQEAGSSSGWTCDGRTVEIRAKTTWTATKGLTVSWATEPSAVFENSYAYSGDPARVDLIIDNAVINLSDSESAPSETFRYRVLVDDTQVGDYFTVTDDGQKQMTLTFDRTGTYRIDAIQTPGNAAGWMYDEVPVTVFAEVALQRDGTVSVECRPEPDAQFINMYLGTDMSVSGGKEWADDEDTSLRPGELTLHLYKETESGPARYVATTTVTPDRDGNWLFDFGRQPLLENGEWITYSLMEDPIPNYIGWSDDLYLMNALQPAKRKTDIPVRVVWESGKGSTRPQQAEITLSANGKPVVTQIATEAENWKTVFEQMPCYDEDGKLILYTVDGEILTGYTMTATQTDAYEFEVRYQPGEALLDIPVHVEWETGDFRNLTVPDSVNVTLYADGVKVRRVKITAGEGWYSEFKNMPAYGDAPAGGGDPRLIEYTLTADKVEPFDDPVIIGDAANGFNVRYGLPGDTRDVGVEVVWEQEEGDTAKIPESVAVTLYADGNKVSTVQVTAKDQWAYQFTDLPSYRTAAADGLPGDLIEYTVSAEKVTGFDAPVISGDDANGFTVTYSSVSDTVDITVRITWVDTNKKPRPTPSRVKVELFGDGSSVGSMKLSAANGWTGVFRNMPQIVRPTGRRPLMLAALGTPKPRYVVYKLVAEEIEGFILKVSGSAKEGFNVTYTAKPVIPPTGDGTPVLPLLGALLLSAGAMAGLICKRKKKA